MFYNMPNMENTVDFITPNCTPDPGSAKNCIQFEEMQYPGIGYFVAAILFLCHGIFANIVLVITINNLKLSLRYKPYYRYAISLAWARVGTGVVGTTLEILWFHKYLSTKQYCYGKSVISSLVTIHWALIFICFIVCFANCITTAVDNFIAIIKPYHYDRLLNKRTVTKSITLAWVLSIIIGFVPLITNFATGSNTFPLETTLLGCEKYEKHTNTEMVTNINVATQSKKLYFF